MRANQLKALHLSHVKLWGKLVRVNSLSNTEPILNIHFSRVAPKNRLVLQASTNARCNNLFLYPVLLICKMWRRFRCPRNLWYTYPLSLPSRSIQYGSGLLCPLELYRKLSFLTLCINMWKSWFLRFKINSKTTA